MIIKDKTPPKWEELKADFYRMCIIEEPFFYFVFDEIDVADVRIPSAFYIRTALGNMTRYRNDMAFFSIIDEFDYNGRLSFHDFMMRLLMLYVEFCDLKKTGSNYQDNIKRWIEYTKIISEDKYKSVYDWCMHRKDITAFRNFYTDLWRSKRRNILIDSVNSNISTVRFHIDELEQNLSISVASLKKSKQTRVSYDISKHKPKIIRIYEFASETSVFANHISEAQFIVAIEKADISEIYNSSVTKKSKLKRILKRINLHMGNKDWYKEITASIESTPTVCSGANTNDEKWNEALEKL